MHFMLKPPSENEPPERPAWIGIVIAAAIVASIFALGYVAKWYLL